MILLAFLLAFTDPISLNSHEPFCRLLVPDSTNSFGLPSYKPSSPFAGTSFLKIFSSQILQRKVVWTIDLSAQSESYLGFEHSPWHKIILLAFLLAFLINPHLLLAGT